MATTDELLEQAQTLMDKPETAEDYLNIDWNTRLITVPSDITNIGVYNDKDTNRLYFRCPIEYGEFKIADFGIHVNYQNTGVSTTKHDGDVYFVDDVESDGDYLTFSWLVGRHAYLEEGTTAFIVCCKVVDSDDNVVHELNTTIATLSVLEGLEVDANPEDYPDYLEELLRRVEAVEGSAIQGINVNGDPAPVTDHIAEIEVVADVPIEHISVNQVEQPIIDKTVDLDIDKASYEEETETIVLGDTFAGAGSIECIKVNGEAQPVRDSTVDIAVPTKVGELENDSGYITDDALEGYAKESDIPTKTSELENDSGYITKRDVPFLYVYYESVNWSVGGEYADRLFITVPNGTPTAVVGFYVCGDPCAVVLDQEPIISGDTVTMVLVLQNVFSNTAKIYGLYVSILCE